MVVCQYFLRGECKFGSTCRNEHPQQRPGSFGNQTWKSNGAQDGNQLTVPFSQEGIQKDLTFGLEKPNWPLSSYGPAKLEPTIIASLDESAEELRWKAVQALRSNTGAEYQRYEAEKIQAANETYMKALGETHKIYKFAHDISVARQQGQPVPRGRVYNSESNTDSPAFGKPTPAFGGGSTFGGSTSAFGGSTFGRTSFGQPAFGQSAFGQTTQPTSTFGQQSQPTQSAFGQPAKPISAFGQASQPSSAFGSTSAFGATSQPQSSFIRPATAFGGTSGGGFSAFSAGVNSAFGSGTQQNTTPAFGQSAFGGATNNSSGSTSAFGNAGQVQNPTFGLPPKPVTAFSQPSQPASAFGQTSQPISAFGQTSQPTSAFGQPSTFGQAAQQPSVFGQPAEQKSVFGQPSQPSSAFAQPSQQTSVFGQPSAFGTSQPSAFGTGTGTGFASLPPKPQVAVSGGSLDFVSALARTNIVQPGKDKHDLILPADYAEGIPDSAKEAFLAPKFDLGKIPEWIPPLEVR